MSNHPQAEKRNRQRIHREEHNRHIRSTMRTFIKRTRAAVDEKKKEVAQQVLQRAISLIDRCAQKKIIPRQRASRIISRLTRQVGTL